MKFSKEEIERLASEMKERDLRDIDKILNKRFRLKSYKGPADQCRPMTIIEGEIDGQAIGFLLYKDPDPLKPVKLEFDGHHTFPVKEVKVVINGREAEEKTARKLYEKFKDVIEFQRREQNNSYMLHIEAKLFDEEVKERIRERKVETEKIIESLLSERQ